MVRTAAIHFLCMHACRKHPSEAAAEREMRPTLSNAYVGEIPGLSEAVVPTILPSDPTNQGTPESKETAFSRDENWIDPPEKHWKSLDVVRSAVD